MDQLKMTPIIAILRGIAETKADATAQALADGGIVFLEVTLNTEGALQMIARIKETQGQRMRIGAGTVLNLAMAKEAAAAGAEYFLSPNLNEDVIYYGLEHGIDVYPGVMTPTEIVRAFEAGAPAVKVFPMGSLGLNYLKEIRAPLNHIPMIATGGVDLNNINEFLDAGAIAVGLGSNLMDKKHLQAGDFEAIEQRARAFVNKVKGVKLA
ncbi:bifunctional 4-hydroxy-2-oxoglutarate aldolase/2-dehydro-3-deoxy-phosphogluconate aldolase [Paenibacillus psychroresistens]|uniref:Bifunctional 4-hydroxy-2-oxoglutarate aldolase/2-dehydro-3-deoxy-phosphogluconate aldolase n=2 Tax=Paenibacillus psychroresistens TaxID=1778678 RepID=A0A6B8RUZ6_9BACL|nr:bifunctional 4-hydroxy-2-oxoglutarate aldolase/2-dehydro-3-deoxy-phosphogluconate aldolase [Paenibacillus psychroresistens]